jgi:quercetin dioxygenase-like cupin family protein
MIKTELENERVKVFDVTFQPGEKAAMHHHPDHVVYVLKGGQLKVTVDGKPDIIDFETGKTLFLKEQSHEVENVGQTTVDLLVVELKK